MQALRGLSHLLDFCYPRLCALCRGPGADGVELCEQCFSLLRQIESLPACPKCAMPIAEPGALCPHCMGEGHPPFQQIVRLSLYRDPLRQIIIDMKYHRQWTLAEFLADRLLARPEVIDLLAEVDVIIPIPLHPWRQFSRGFNQADVIAQRIAATAKKKFARPLVRLRNTETQTHLHDKKKRFDNLRDAFGLLRPGKVTDQRVLLVDDVMTTGATLVSAARVLLEAEPASVNALVAAVADPRGKDFEEI